MVHKLQIHIVCTVQTTFDFGIISFNQNCINRTYFAYRELNFFINIPYNNIFTDKSLYFTYFLEITPYMGKIF